MVLEALKHRYSKDTSDTDKSLDGDLSNFLNAEETMNTTLPLLNLIKIQHPDWLLSQEQIAILACVDDCTKLIFNITRTDSVIEEALRRAIPELAAQLLQNPELPFSDEPNLISLLDELNEGLVGWVPNLGAGGSKLKEKLDSTISSIVAENTDAKALFADVSSFMAKERKRTNKLEERLAASETGKVRAQQSKVLSAKMINHATQNHLVTETLIDFLYGPWFDSIQLIVLSSGIEGEEWQRAEKITETLVRTYQAIDPDNEDSDKDKQHLYRVIEHLPSEIKTLLVALAHNTATAESSLKIIESDHVSIVSGQTLDYVEFEPLESDESAFIGSKVSKILLRKVKAFEVGQWFTFTEGDSAVRIKLVLKLDDVRQLLFTNRNGMKVLQKSYEEFAYYLASHTVKALNRGGVFKSTYRNYFEGLIGEYEKHQKLIANRKIEVEEQDIERKSAREKALSEAKKLAIDREDAKREKLILIKQAQLDVAKVEAGKAENAGLVSKYKLSVAQLNTGALLTLPNKDDKPAKCKLAVKITSADKMIFVNLKGIRVGEYSSIQLVQLLVAGLASIQDDGIEFEDTLAQVVSKLRNDRNKSYGDLTGE